MILNNPFILVLLGLVVSTLAQNFVYTYDADASAPPQSNLFDLSAYHFVPPSGIQQGQPSHASQPRKALANRQSTQEEFNPQRASPVSLSSYPERQQNNFGAYVPPLPPPTNQLPTQPQIQPEYSSNSSTNQAGQLYNQFPQYDGVPFQYFNMLSHSQPTHSYNQQTNGNRDQFSSNQQPNPVLNPMRNHVDQSYNNHVRTPFYQPSQPFLNSIQPAFDSFLRSNEHLYPQQAQPSYYQPPQQTIQPSQPSPSPQQTQYQPYQQPQQTFYQQPQQTFYQEPQQTFYQQPQQTPYQSPVRAFYEPSQPSQNQPPVQRYNTQDIADDYFYNNQQYNFPDSQRTFGQSDLSYQPEQTPATRAPTVETPRIPQRTVTQQRPVGTRAPVVVVRSRGTPTERPVTQAPTPNRSASRNTSPDVTETTRSSAFKPSNIKVSALPKDVDGDGIPGEAGNDYPTLHVIPKTSFSCGREPLPGYYSDVETACQVVHFCQAGGTQHSFLCPNGTIFNQEKFSCQWWYRVDCASAPSYYSLNDNLYKTTTPKPRNQRPAQRSGK